MKYIFTNRMPPSISSLSVDRASQVLKLLWLKYEQERAYNFLLEQKAECLQKVNFSSSNAMMSYCTGQS